MKRNLEAEMAAALEGQFFWERTTKYDDMNLGMAAEIRRAQRMFSSEGPNKRDKPPTAEVEQSIASIKKAIMDLYGLDEDELDGGAGNKRLFPARPHYIWCLMRYNPDVSRSSMSRFLKKHHTSLLHNQRLFEQNKHLFPEKIKHMDDMFNYRSGRFDASIS